ncbi:MULTISPECIES: phosphogluconate dehydratase [unclassified Arsukibacterium]|uniref:phosphogluconate dehydratase n=1 Tax=unclassified Arsukibacterium TaxID=2635278 RepID=UPI000C3C51CA|nr:MULTISPECIES: phosphogluconate dehydratase [unclassified Arsukibacterium]MAA93885.1 phosphogluconate dehydratase [Rheinheimera sp.]MBM33336.1 phosphogluconate dehydratase [Rheinheimera sp.]HAW94115.1 phosphogluconate dehydratase [Candidatus Azambacteria bacterium]|tara:strand:- start:78725 stop:80557 length:1833 start_codon:yes stop_codon:yes gene_type:complete
MNPVIQRVTDRIIARSSKSRAIYLARIEEAGQKGPHRGVLSCGNLAHGFAACNKQDKADLRSLTKANIGIISSYNDMLSAHQPYEAYPEIIKQAVNDVGSVAQFAGGVPAMCDGVTQGQPGMELSLLSRDIIAMSAAVGLSHNMFDGGLMLGICDKIVPGLLMSALSFGHLPFVFVPAGPMPSGIPNKEKARVRQLFAEGKVGKEELLEAESASYHSAGTCTFYGTANSNQLVVEMMGLHLPGSSFVNPGSALRDELTKAAARQVTRLTQLGNEYLPVGKLVDAKALVNGIVGLLATGGSTNHTMHLVAVARSAGYIVNWDDFAELSAATPLLTRIYPNGQADINHFQHAGGMALLIRELLDAGLLHEDVQTIAGPGLRRYTQQPLLKDGKLHWVDAPAQSLDPDVLATVAKPFKSHGGLEVLSGNIGRAILKTSALRDGTEVIKAPAVVFQSQHELDAAFKSGELNKDCIVVVRFQGPKACGMPELHKLTPPLGVLQDRGFKVALVTDGRMSGASGKVPAAIHVTPEAVDGGAIGRIKTGDMILVDGNSGKLEVLVDESEFNAREQAQADLSHNFYGMGREMFGAMRAQLSGAEQGACSLFVTEEHLHG